MSEEIKKIIDAEKYFYHRTERVNIDSISKNGLVTNYLAQHPDCRDDVKNKNSICFVNRRNLMRVEDAFLPQIMDREEELKDYVVIRVEASEISNKLFSLDYSDTQVDGFKRRYKGKVETLDGYKQALEQLGTIAVYERIPVNLIEIVDRDTLEPIDKT